MMLLIYDDVYYLKATLCYSAMLLLLCRAAIAAAKRATRLRHDADESAAIIERFDAISMMFFMLLGYAPAPLLPLMRLRRCRYAATPPHYFMR